MEKKSLSSTLLWRMFREMCAVLQGGKIQAIEWKCYINIRYSINLYHYQHLEVRIYMTANENSTVHHPV
jgi:hypothetical protein